MQIVQSRYLTFQFWTTEQEDKLWNICDRSDRRGPQGDTLKGLWLHLIATFCFGMSHEKKTYIVLQDSLFHTSSPWTVASLFFCNLFAQTLKEQFIIEWKFKCSYLIPLSMENKILQPHSILPSNWNSRLGFKECFHLPLPVQSKFPEV